MTKVSIQAVGTLHIQLSLADEKGFEKKIARTVQLSERFEITASALPTDSVFVVSVLRRCLRESESLGVRIPALKESSGGIYILPG